MPGLAEFGFGNHHSSRPELGFEVGSHSGFWSETATAAAVRARAQFVSTHPDSNQDARLAVRDTAHADYISQQLQELYDTFGRQHLAQCMTARQTLPVRLAAYQTAIDATAPGAAKTAGQTAHDAMAGIAVRIGCSAAVMSPTPDSVYRGAPLLLAAWPMATTRIPIP